MGEDITAAVQAVIADAKAKAADGMTWAEFGSVLVNLLHRMVVQLDAVSSLAGADKKAAAIAAASALFDACAPATAFTFWMLVRPAARTLVLSLASGAVESLLKISRSRSE